MTRDRAQSLIASAALHAALLLATLVTWPWARELKVGASVPINIVSNAPATNLRPAIQDTQDQEAQTPAPVPEPTPEPPQPQPAPQPAPPPPTPQPKAPTPTPKAVQPTPKAPTPKATQPAPKTPPAKTPPAKTQPKASDNFLDSLAADVAKMSKSSGTRGPARPETATQARPNLGTGLSANATEGLTEELQKHWNPSCVAEDARNARVRVTFTVSGGGRVVPGSATADGMEKSSNQVIANAADRAIRAVYAASPLQRLPSSYRGPITANFNPRDVCF